VLALTTALPAARSQAAPPAPIPKDLVGSFVAPPDQSDLVFNRHGLRAIYQLVHRKPLLVVSWRADDPASLERAVPAALELAQRYPDDLMPLFVERSGRSFDDMLRVACRQRWLCSDALWTCEQPAGLEVMPAPSFVLTSIWHRGVLTGDLVADRAALEAAVEVVVRQRRLGEDDLPDEAHAAWKACAEGQWIAALKLRGAAEKRRARGQPGDAEAADVLDEQLRLLDDVLMNELQIAEGMTRSGSGVEGRRRAETIWKEVKDLPADHRLRRTTDSLIQSVHHETLSAELDASEALAKLQDKLCRAGPSGSLAASFRKLAKEHTGTGAAERALVYAAMMGED
jgi:hypothetical protein